MDLIRQGTLSALNLAPGGLSCPEALAAEVGGQEYQGPLLL
jgi:hypothetical protein